MRIGRLVGDIYLTLQKILNALDNNLTFSENMSVYEVAIPDSGPADEVITVAHGLQRIPVGYVWNVDRAGIVYDYQRSQWNNSQITVKCSVPNASLNLILL